MHHSNKIKSNMLRIAVSTVASLSMFLLILAGWNYQPLASQFVTHSNHSHNLAETHVDADVVFGVYSRDEIDSIEAQEITENFSTKTPPRISLGPVNDQLTIVIDFIDTSQGTTTDILGNVLGPFDVTEFGFAASDRDMFTAAVLAAVREDYFDDWLLTDIGRQGLQLDLNIIEGDIGTPPPGVSEYYFVQCGTPVEDPNSGPLGVTIRSAVRNPQGTGPNGPAENGDVVATVNTFRIPNIPVSPPDLFNSGNLTFSVNSLAGTISHEIGHILSLTHLDVADSVSIKGGPPVMGTGANGFSNRLRVVNRELTFSGFNSVNNNQPGFHFEQLIGSVGLTEGPGPGFMVVGLDNFDGGELFESRTLTPNLPNGTFPSQNSVFGIVDRNVTPSFADETFGGGIAGSFSFLDFDQFLAHSDLLNPSNPFGTAFVEYEFDITEQNNMFLSIDIAAMGQFEAIEDSSRIMISIDDGPEVVLLDLIVDENATQTYSFDNGATSVLPRPIRVNDVLLDNSFQNFEVPISGTGSLLTLRFEFAGNGISENVAFDNLLIGANTVTNMLGDVNCDGVVDLLDVDPFVDILLNGTEFVPKADLNFDGANDLLDVAPFVALLLGN